MTGISYSAGNILIYLGSNIRCYISVDMWAKLLEHISFSCPLQSTIPHIHEPWVHSLVHLPLKILSFLIRNQTTSKWGQPNFPRQPDPPNRSLSALHNQYQWLLPANKISSHSSYRPIWSVPSHPVQQAQQSHSYLLHHTRYVPEIFPHPQPTAWFYSVQQRRTHPFRIRSSGMPPALEMVRVLTDLGSSDQRHRSQPNWRRLTEMGESGSHARVKRQYWRGYLLDRSGVCVWECCG